MGLSLSCLQSKARELDPVLVKPEAASTTAVNHSQRTAPISRPPCCKDSHVSPNTGAPVGVATVSPSSTAEPATTTGEGALVPHPEALAPHPAVVLDTLHTDKTAAMTATASSLSSSMYSSFNGYPHSAWELGPPCTDHEQTRLQALRALDVLDAVSVGRRTRLDEEIDMVLNAVMQTFHAATAMLVFFEESRIVIRNAKGIMDVGEFPYRWSFCAYTLTKQRPQTLLVPDATQDARFADNPFVTGKPGIRFYCGAPLVAASGHILGTLCFADTAPRPQFDTGQCCLANNMAELMVRQLERYRANAGPTGSIDAETTALARVARTIDCYEAVTGLVDISLPGGWMMMYVNEAWEVLCAPWSRKQLVGRSLQVLLRLETETDPDPDPGTNAAAAVGSDLPSPSPPGPDQTPSSAVPPTATCGITVQEQPRRPWQGQPRAEGDGDLDTTSGLTSASAGGGVADSAAMVVCQTPSTSTSTNPATNTGTSTRERGIVLEPGVAPLLTDQGRQLGARRERQQMVAAAAAGGPREQRAEVWRRLAAALRLGEEVHIGPSRLMLEDGRPSTTLVQVHVRPANCHVLDAATRMPIGVPPQAVLPASILGAAAAAAAPGGATAPPLFAPSEGGSACTGGSAAAAPPWREVDAGSAADDAYGSSRVDPHYCFVTMSPIQLDDNGPESSSLAAAAAEGLAVRPPRRPLQPVWASEGLKASPSSAPIIDGETSSGNAVQAGSAAHIHQAYVRSTRSVHQSSASSSAAAFMNMYGGRTSRLGGGGRASLEARNAAKEMTSVASSSRGGGNFVPGSLAAAGAAAVAVAAAAPAVPVAGVAPVDTNGECSGANASQRLSRFCGSVQARTGTSQLSDFSYWTYGKEPFPGLRLGHMLGKGGYGRVFAATYKGQKVAAKVVSNSMLKTATCVNGVTMEALLAQEFDHPYIVRTYKCVVRSYLPSGFPSLAELGTRGAASLMGSEALGWSASGMSEAGGGIGGGASVRGMPSPMPYGNCGRGDAAREMLRGLSQATSSIPALPPAATCSISAAGGDGAAATTYAPMTVTAATTDAPIPTLAVVDEKAAVAAAADPEDFDSFDVGCDEESAGMIDQLTSGQPAAGAPPYALSHAPSHAPSRHSAVSGTTQRPVANADGAGASTATADVDQSVAAALGSPGPAPKLPFEHVAAATASVDGQGDCASVFVAAAASFRPSIHNEALPEGETWILQEYCTRGTLQDAIDVGRLRTEASRIRGEPNLAAILLTSQEMASAMHCLHSRGYMHGDLSAVNVLLTEPPGGGAQGASAGTRRGWISKVSDFGLAKHLPDPSRPYVSSAYGVITHCAPEVLKSHCHTQKADSYSFGVLLWQMWTGARPWANMNRFQIMAAVTSSNSPGLRFLPNQQPPPRYRNLTMRCLSYDPVVRPTFAEICEELRLMTLDAAAAGLLPN